MRYVHTVVYLREIQPWRTLAFTAGGLLTLGVLVQVTRAAFARLMLLMG